MIIHKLFRGIITKLNIDHRTIAGENFLFLINSSLNKNANSHKTPSPAPTKKAVHFTEMAIPQKVPDRIKDITFCL